MWLTSQSPALSVVMSVYNGSAYLEVAVRSILTQTFQDFEFIIVDDCSSDDTPEILEKLASADPRIRILRLEQNRQIAGALNAGLELARAPLIARMDADDISYPTRLMRQMAIMDEDPDLVLLGTSIRHVDPHRTPIRIDFAASNPEAAKSTRQAACSASSSGDHK